MNFVIFLLLLLNFGFVEAQPCYKIFKSSNNVPGNLGGIEGADLICDNDARTGVPSIRAIAQSSEFKFVALLSNATINAIDRLTTNCYEEPSGSRIISNGKLFFSATSAENDFFERANGANIGRQLWTGTTPEGVASLIDCNGWTTNSGSGTVLDVQHHKIEPDVQSCGVNNVIACVQISAMPTPPPAPTPLTTPSCRRVFVTSKSMPTGGMFGDMIEADRFCTKMVEENGTPELKMLLSRNLVGFKAIIANDTVSVMDRFVNDFNKCLVRIDGLSVATTLDDAISLTRINNPINVLENGTTIDMNQFYVITGLKEKNETGENCNNWKSGAANVDVGDAMRTDRGWLRDRTQNCNSALPVYCMETEPYTLPPSPADSIDNCHVIFVTKSTEKGNFGGQATADTHCSADATANGNAVVASRMSSGYLAWVSSRNDPLMAINRFNFTADACFVRADGFRVANTVADLLDGSLATGLLHADGTLPTVKVWTGTANHGVRASQDCVGWAFGVIGWTGESGIPLDPSEWSGWNSIRCDAEQAFICVSKTLIAANAPTPVPTPKPTPIPTPLPTPPADADCDQYIDCGQCVSAPPSKQCHWCESSTLVGAGQCRNGTTACQSQFPVDVMNGQTCPTAAPTPKPTPQPTPSPTPSPTPLNPTPDPSAPCYKFSICSQCTNKSLHPTRDCRWCEATNGCTTANDVAATCSSTFVIDGAVCATPAPTPAPTVAPTPAPTPMPTPAAASGLACGEYVSCGQCIDGELTKKACVWCYSGAIGFCRGEVGLCPASFPTEAIKSCPIQTTSFVYTSASMTDSSTDTKSDVVIDTLTSSIISSSTTNIIASNVQSSSPGLSMGIMIAIIAAAVVCLLATIGLVAFLIRRKKSSNDTSTNNVQIPAMDTSMHSVRDVTSRTSDDRSSEYQDVEAIAAQSRYATLPSDVVSDRPSHYAVFDVKQNDYSNWSDAKQSMPDHYANVDL